MSISDLRYLSYMLPPYIRHTRPYGPLGLGLLDRYIGNLPSPGQVGGYWLPISAQPD